MGDQRPAPFENISALVLAGGGSRRFGARNKLLHAWRGRRVLDHTLDALLSSGIEQTLVVTGDDRLAVEAALRGRADAPPSVHNPDWRRGLSASLACGLSALLDRSAVLVCLADMPLVSGRTIDGLLHAAAGSIEHWLAMPVCGGRRGNPVLIRQPLFEAVLALEGDTGARVLARRFPERVLEVVTDSASVLQDIDTRDDQARLLR